MQKPVDINAGEVGTGPGESPRLRPGFTVFLTGLSAAGKTTIADALMKLLPTLSGRPVTLLDGDQVRRRLSPDLGFSKADRDLHIRRIGSFASEISKDGGIAVCAVIAPYDSVRKEVRQLVENHGRFVLVYVATPLSVCEQRDPKGLYVKARAGLIKEFTGISDPYESPDDAELTIYTDGITPDEAASQILQYLEKESYLESAESGARLSDCLFHTIRNHA
jgi:sulfate adenylyltransferase